MKASKIIQIIIFALKICCIVSIVVNALVVLGGVIGLSETILSENGGVVTEIVIEDILDFTGVLSTAELRVILGGTIVVATSELLVCIFLFNYFKHELDDGTPFTFKGAKELLFVGIKALICFAAAMAICCFIRLIAFGNTELSALETDFLNVSGMGGEMILMSLLLRFGAEEKESKE